MQFNCGPTWGERKAAKEQWHDWFAWRPVRVGSGDCRWLEKVERIGDWYCGPSGAFWAFEYREKAK